MRTPYIFSNKISYILTTQCLEVLMEDWNTRQMTPFDCRVASPTLQITKLLIPYLPPNTQRILAIYVKFMEFQNTFSTFQTFRQKSNSTQDIIQDLIPFMPPSTCESLEQIQTMLSMMELFQGFDEESMSEMFGSMFSPEGGTNND